MGDSFKDQRKLFLLCDGSSNTTARSKSANDSVMYKVNQALSNGVRGEQISYYFSGVGTRGDKFSAVTGEGLNEIIADAYINLSSNYADGDLIYLFGFSRGAVAARCLAGLISNVGLLHDSKLSARFPEVWEMYKKYSLPTAKARVDELRAAMHKDLHHPRIRFLGAFDSVPGDKYDKFNLMEVHAIRDLTLPPAVEHGLHLLSADDNRIPSFQPLLWEPPLLEGQTLDQIWMPGVHADVGGCSESELIGNLAVLTMLEEIEKHCPEVLLDTSFVTSLVNATFNSNKQIVITNERVGFWRKILSRRRRSPMDGVNQSRHYLLQQLTGRTLKIRGRTKRYCAQHITKTVEKRHRTKYQSEIDKLVAVLSQRNRCCDHCQ